MKSLRTAAFALGAALALGATGCRTAGVRDFTRIDPLPFREGDTAEVLLEEHNRNAARVASLEARPSISVSSGGKRGGVNGSLAFERPKNFKLVLSSTVSLGNLADIGSNDQEFWFWLKESPEKAVFFCNYDESGVSPLASSLQPDWVVEAFGLNEISVAEASRIKVKPGKEPGTLVLTHQAHERQGMTFVKETILNESTRRVREHRVYSQTGDRKLLLAQAIISEYQNYSLPARTGEPASAVFLPKKMRLEWTQEQLVLDISLNSVKVNPGFDETRRQALFIEPEIRGTARVNLAERAGLASGAMSIQNTERSTVRQSLPVPPPRVRMNAPLPLGERRMRQPESDPSGLVASDIPPLMPRGVEEVIGPPIPTVSEPAPSVVHANPGWKTRLAQGADR